MTKELPMVYQAVLRYPGEVISPATAEDGRPLLKFKLGEQEMELPVLPHVHRRLSEQPILGPCQFLIYPRTNQEGVLWQGAWVADVYLEPHHHDGLLVLGELARIDRSLGLILVKLYPNPKGGMKRPFNLPLNASLELIDSLPPLYSGVLIEGTFRERSLRLMVTSVREVPLPPTRQKPPAPKPKPKPQPKAKAQPKVKKKAKPYKPDQVVRAKRKWG